MDLDLDKTSLDITMDTNVIRDLGKRKSDNKEEQKQYGLADTAVEEIKQLALKYHGGAAFFIPKEVDKELRIQKFTLKNKILKECNKIEQTCIKTTEENCDFDTEWEIRKLSGYLRGKYSQVLANDLREKGVNGIEYLKVSDARVLYAALERETILLTNNMKDFWLYILLRGNNPSCAYYIKENKFINFDKSTYEQIIADGYYIEAAKKILENL